MGKAVKQYDDVDVFVLVSDSSMTLFTHLWNVLQGENSVNLHVISDAYDRLVFNDILTVVNFGKVQLVFRYYPGVCGCDYHVNKTVFENFHHCTRWKLDVFDNCIMPRCYFHARGFVACQQFFLGLVVLVNSVSNLMLGI